MRVPAILAVAALLASTSSLHAEAQAEPVGQDQVAVQAPALQPSALRATDAPVVDPTASEVRASEGPAFALGDTPLRPAELVASRVREVLRDHSDDAAWQELAGALPEMALSGDADIESTFEAARIAEDMVPAAAAVPSVSTATRSEAFDAVLRFVRGVDADLVGQLLAIAFGLFALTMLLKGTGARGSRVDPTKGRCREARALAAGGVPAYEISRRTGLAREAVSVLLSQASR